MEHMTPVILLTDGFIANGSEPWCVPSMKDYPTIHPPVLKERPEDWKPYARDAERLARTWAHPGTPDLEHRIGGLEKDEFTGSVSHDPENHQRMTELRAAKVKAVERVIPELEVEGEQEGDLLLVGWGGTYGHLATAVNELKKKGTKIGFAHFHYINPLPANTEEVFKRYKKILIAELNMGQFATYLRSLMPQFNYIQYNKVQGLPFTVIELENKIENVLEEK
jgi:2-oxoglutarate ferredoxin oxidoreductase subunit alpha